MDNYIYLITEATLKMHGVEPTQDLVARHQALLSKRSAVFHYNRSVIKSYTVPFNVAQWSIGQLFAGEIPYEALVCFVPTDQYLGTRTGSPFNFKHFDVEFVTKLTQSICDAQYKNARFFTHE